MADFKSVKADILKAVKASQMANIAAVHAIMELNLVTLDDEQLNELHKLSELHTEFRYKGFGEISSEYWRRATIRRKAEEAAEAAAAAAEEAKVLDQGYM